MENSHVKRNSLLIFNDILLKVLWVVWVLISFLLWTFYSEGNSHDFQLLIDDFKLGDGFVTYKEFTGTTVNGHEIYEFYYNYTYEGEIFSDRSFGYNLYGIDSPVTIQYSLSDPTTISRIVGQENTVIGLTLTIVLACLFMLVTFLLAYRFFKLAKKKDRY